MANKRSFGTMTDQQIGGFVSRLRSVVGRIGSQAKAAEVAGVSLAQLKNYLTGASSPPLMPMQRLVDASGVDMAWLVHGDSAEAARFRAAMDEGAELVKALRELERLKSIYAEAGFDFASVEEQDKAIGAAIDCVRAYPSSCWLMVAKTVVATQAAALQHAARRVGERERPKSG